MNPCCASWKTRATRHILAGVVPGMVLLFLPKCPACLAAYLALGAGIAVSLADASILRAGLVTLSVLGLMVLAVSFLIRHHDIPKRS